MTDMNRHKIPKKKKEMLSLSQFMDLAFHWNSKLIRNKQRKKIYLTNTIVQTRTSYCKLNLPKYPIFHGKQWIQCKNTSDNLDWSQICCFLFLCLYSILIVGEYAFPLYKYETDRNKNIGHFTDSDRIVFKHMFAYTTYTNTNNVEGSGISLRLFFPIKKKKTHFLISKSTIQNVK